MFRLEHLDLQDEAQDGSASSMHGMQTTWGL
jgi:hypothetical protein